MKPSAASYDNPRIIDLPDSNAWQGKVHYEPVRSIWYTSMLLIGLIGGALTLSLENALVFLISSAITLCLGHSLGMHRRFIHHSYDCPKWLEYLFVWLGVLVGLAGPLCMMRTHDLRDWAQRQARCHPYFGHKTSFWRDGFWQLHCDIQLEHPPEFRPDDAVVNDRLYRFMERYWMAQQLPVALLLFAMGGIDWVIWGVCLRVAVSCTGHWLIGHFAHNSGHQDFRVEGAAVQGFNVKFCGLITFGECWHNNHHAYPGSARLGLKAHQADPGWWVLRALEWCGLVRNLKQPEDLAPRPELKSVFQDM